MNWYKFNQSIVQEGVSTEPTTPSVITQPPAQAPVQAPIQTPVQAPVEAPASIGRIVVTVVTSGGRAYVQIRPDGPLPPKTGKFFLDLNTGWNVYRRGTDASITKNLTIKNKDQILEELQNFEISTGIPVDKSKFQIPGVVTEKTVSGSGEKTSTYLTEIYKEVQGLSGEEREKKLAEIIKTKIEELASLVSKSNPDLVEFLMYSARLHQYSMMNQLLILLQTGGKATEVSSERRWGDLGRKVKEGTNPIYVRGPAGGTAPITRTNLGQVTPDIRAAVANYLFLVINPNMGKADITKLDKRAKAFLDALLKRYNGDQVRAWKEASQRISRMGGGEVKRFMDMPVYDITQTEIDPEFSTKYPDMKPYTGIKNEWWMSKENRGDQKSDFLLKAAMQFASNSKINIEDEAISGGTAGYSSGGQIRISKENLGERRLRVVIHELAHEILHWAEGKQGERSEEGQKSSRMEKETDADATAYVVLNFFGYPADYAAAYLQMHGSASEVVKNRHMQISKAVAKIINGMLPLLLAARNEVPEPTTEPQVVPPTIQSLGRSWYKKAQTATMRAHFGIRIYHLEQQNPHGEWLKDREGRARLFHSEEEAQGIIKMLPENDYVQYAVQPMNQ